jgi:BirA family biotin operon repressor/biotin-[acetyl-CoA-carboxylase] ligase
MQVIRFDAVSSTQLAAREVVERGELGDTPFVVVAAEQTGGRGRFGRAWLSPRGGLWMTFVYPLRDPRQVGALPLRVGLVCCEVLEGLVEPWRRGGLELKWPNDVLIEGRKLVGILGEVVTHAGRPSALLGIGINGNYPAASLHPPADAPALRTSPTTLLDWLGCETDLEHLLEQLAAALLRDMQDHVSHELEGTLDDALRARIEARMGGASRTLTVTLPTGEAVIGSLVRLTPDGRLVLRTSDGESIISGGAEVQEIDDNRL